MNPFSRRHLVALEARDSYLAGDPRDRKAVFWQGWMHYLGGLWNPDRGMQRAGPSSWANKSMQTVTDSRAFQIAAVFRCIRIIAETCAAIPMYGYLTKPNGDRDRLPDEHWLSRLLYEPNEVMTGDEWAEAMFSNMAGWGNAYSDVPKSESDGGRPLALWPLKVDRMEVERQENRTLIYRYPNAIGSPITLPPARILHLRAFSTDGYMGLSPLALARESLGVTIGAENYAASFYASNGRPSGVMTSDKVLQEKQREQIRKEYGGMADGGSDKRFWLLEGDLKYQAITVNPEDLQMLQTRAFQIAEVARMFGVPLFLLMETEKSTTWGTGIEQQNLAFLIYTLWPYLTRMRCTFNRRVIPERDRTTLSIDHDLGAFLRMDSKALGEFLASMTTNGLMTRNEARTIYLKLARQAGADELTAQVNLAPLAALGRLAQERPPAAKEQPVMVFQNGGSTEGGPLAPELEHLRTMLQGLGAEMSRLDEKIDRKRVTRTIPKRGADGRIQETVTVEE